MKNLSRCELGQAVVLTAFFLFAFGLFSALSVDVGLYMVDRRDGQNDVDKAALAGALELTLASSTSAVDEAAAEAAALEWAVKNGIDTSEPGLTLSIDAINTCYSADDGVPTGVEVSLTREPTSFFMGFVEAVTPVDDWTVNTTAVACAGRPIDMIGILPFAISRYDNDCFDTQATPAPILGAVCELIVDDTAEGAVGFLSIASSGGTCEDATVQGAGGNALLGSNIESGTSVRCAIDDLVHEKSGSPSQVRAALTDRLQGDGSGLVDGACEDALQTSSNWSDGNAALFNAFGDLPFAPNRSDDVDDFFEVWAYDSSQTNPVTGLVPYDCDPQPGLQTSPRNIVVIIVDDYANPDVTAPDRHTVRGFARVYIEGCSRGMNFYKSCQLSGGQPFKIHVRFVDQVSLSTSNLGLDATYGDIEVFLKQ